MEPRYISQSEEDITHALTALLREGMKEGDVRRLIARALARARMRIDFEQTAQEEAEFEHACQEPPSITT
jgi:hypothetical protein